MTSALKYRLQELCSVLRNTATDLGHLLTFIHKHFTIKDTLSSASAVADKTQDTKQCINTEYATKLINLLSRQISTVASLLGNAEGEWGMCKPPTDEGTEITEIEKLFSVVKQNLSVLREEVKNLSVGDIHTWNECSTEQDE